MQNTQAAEGKAVSQRKPGEVFFSVLVVVFGALGYYFAMDMTSGEYSSPSVAPKVASVVIMAMGATELYRVLKKQAVEVTPLTLIKHLFTWDVVFILTLLALYSVFLPRLHFPLASFLFLLTSLFYLQRGKNFLLCLAVSVGSVGAMVGIFTYIFKVMLP